MNYMDIEWRQEVRKQYGINLMPEMYGVIWKTFFGKKIAFQIVVKRLKQRTFNQFSFMIFQIGQYLCSQGFHKWKLYEQEVSVNGYSRVRKYSCSRCPERKVVRR